MTLPTRLQVRYRNHSVVIFADKHIHEILIHFLHENLQQTVRNYVE